LFLFFFFCFDQTVFAGQKNNNAVTCVTVVVVVVAMVVTAVVSPLVFKLDISINTAINWYWCWRSGIKRVMPLPSGVCGG